MGIPECQDRDTSLVFHHGCLAYAGLLVDDYTLSLLIVLYDIQRAQMQGTARGSQLRRFLANQLSQPPTCVAAMHDR